MPIKYELHTSTVDVYGDSNKDTIFIETSPDLGPYARNCVQITREEAIEVGKALLAWAEERKGVEK